MQGYKPFVGTKLLGVSIGRGFGALGVITPLLLETFFVDKIT